MPTDFAIYPPEINSLRMYTGPGPGPMLAAVQAWDALADELYTSASGSQSVVTEVIQTAWSGPSSQAMSAAAEAHIRWLSVTAAQAEHTAVQARMAVAAYEAAFLATVPPAEVFANRSLLAALVATNFLGQNTPAIAATEALYAEMWAQDALAMYTYAGSSAAAVMLTPFSSPDQIADPGATAGQAAAVAGNVTGQAQNAISVVPQALSVLAAPAQGSDFGLLAALATLLLVAPGDFAGVIVLAPIDALTGFAEVPGASFTTLSGLLDDKTFSHYNGEQPWPGDGPAPLWAFPAPLSNPPAGVLSAPTTAAFGEANLVGTLSVPSSWTAAAPEIRAVALTTPLAAAPATQVGAAMAGQAMVGPPPSGLEQHEKPMTHARLTRAPAAVPAVSAPRKVLTGVVAAIRAIARQRAEGLLSDEEYNERKKDLLDSAECAVLERATGIEPA